MRRRSFLVMNREEYWRAGFAKGLKIRGGCLELGGFGGVADGAWYSPAFDSRERDFEWSRLVVEGDFPENTLVSVGAFASNEAGPGGLPVGELLREGQTDALDRLFSEGRPGGDLLLSCRGRYLWIRLEVVAAGGAARVTAVKAQYGGDHMTDYLPAAYRREGRSGFPWRFLSLFDSLALDLEEQIDHTAGLFDYERAQGGMLRFLASWVDADEDGLDDGRLRENIARAAKWGCLAQTPEGIRSLVKSWTGAEPILLEHWQVEEFLHRGKDRALYARLYGTAPNQFFLLMEEGVFRDAGESDELLARLGRVLPANVSAKLILLRRDAYLDWHTYLGVNTGIGGYTPASIGEGAAIRYDTMIGGEEDDKPEPVSR